MINWYLLQIQGLQKYKYAHWYIYNSEKTEVSSIPNAFKHAL